VETGDTRITVIEVLNLLPEQLIPKEEMLKELKKEAPHLLRTLLDLPLPPVINRLRLPVIVTDSKLTLMRDNLPYAPVLPFVDAMCEFDGFCGRPQLYAAYCAWIDTKTFQPFSEAAFRAELLRVTKDCKVHDDGRRLMVDEKKVFVIDGISLKGGAA
jgi:hypothetical protein